MGYRKGSGNTCVGGVEKLDLELKCPMTWKLNLLAKMCAFIIVILMVYTVYRFKRHLPEVNVLQGQSKTEITKTKYENLDHSQEDNTPDNIIFDDDFDSFKEISPRHGRKTSDDANYSF